MSTVKLNQIRPSLALSSLSAEQLVARANAVITGISGNRAFPNPPVEPAALKAAIDAFLAATAEALDSKKARVERNKRRVDLIRKLRQVGHYVEANCNDDASTLVSSGFEPRSAGPAPPQTLPPAGILKLEQGASGQLLVHVKALRKARYYELRYAPVGQDGPPGDWTTAAISTARTASPISSLTPGVTYVVQVRAYGNLGYTAWSDSASRMCI